MVLQHGYYEEEVLQALLEDIRPDDVFLDIGACLGIHALTVAKFHPTVRVSAFEPNPAMARLIRQAAADNDLRVTIHPVALGAAEGEAEFFVEKDNAGCSGFGHWGHAKNAEKISVPLTTADALLATGSVAAPHLIKLDVEGGELDVLRGMAGVLRNPALRRVVFEDGRDPRSALKVLLAETGFHIRQLMRSQELDHGLENFVASR